MSNQPLENKTANKAIIQLDPQVFEPKSSELAGFDLKPFLFKELLLKEKDFREGLANFDFSAFQDKKVYIHCTFDAIIPMWAHMLVASYLLPFTNAVIFAADKTDAEEQFMIQNIENVSLETYKNQRIIIRGCGDKKRSPLVYTTLMTKLQPTAKAIMFGESCSMVPVFRKK